MAAEDVINGGGRKRRKVTQIHVLIVHSVLFSRGQQREHFLLHLADDFLRFLKKLPFLFSCGLSLLLSFDEGAPEPSSFICSLFLPTHTRNAFKISRA